MLKLDGEVKEKTDVPETLIQKLDTYWRAVNYLSVAQIYLKSNALLTRELQPGDIKARLLGHWGTVPGINFIYAHLNRLILEKDANILLVVGPGHGAPSFLSNLFLERSLEEVDPDLNFSPEGIDLLCRQFSWPGGAPSHLVPDTPGTIQEGGELGYCLAHAYGAVFDNPDLITACLIGDGEAETGPLAASWFCNRFLNPATSGAVLPILHLNEIKLSGPTVFGRMDDSELENYFSGMGYHPCILSGDEPSEMHRQCIQALNWAHEEIRKIQSSYRSNPSDTLPRFPMLILRTPKGWTCPKKIDDHDVEGTRHSHQIPVPDPKGSKDHLKILEEWLSSYRPHELFSSEGEPADEILELIPEGEKRIGKNPHANGGGLLQPLDLPDYTGYALTFEKPGTSFGKATTVLGKWVRDIMKNNASNFRFFCPDETTSNRMDAIFEATGRAWTAPVSSKDEFLEKDGRVIEILSEHVCQGLLEGYLVTGRHGIFACYEAFIPIVDSMLNQFAKWLKVARETTWRKPIASLNYLLTSHVWRQDHNGYSHQVPTFINNLVNKKQSVARIYLPPDANCLLCVADHCLRSRDYVNLIVASKQEYLQWLTIEEAKEHCKRGASVWEWAGQGEGEPDIILCAAGDVPTTETVAAAAFLREQLPDLIIRVINIIDLFVLIPNEDHSHGISQEEFIELFTRSTDVIFAFHGYPRLIHELIHHRPKPDRFHVHGYIEEGTTTTPFDMLMLNKMSRYDLALAALERLSPKKFSGINQAKQHFQHQLKKSKEYLLNRGKDMPEITGWTLKNHQ